MTNQNDEISSIYFTVQFFFTLMCFWLSALCRRLLEPPVTAAVPLSPSCPFMSLPCQLRGMCDAHCAAPDSTVTSSVSSL